jgi:hypothetical protein
MLLFHSYPSPSRAICWILSIHVVIAMPASPIQRLDELRLYADWFWPSCKDIYPIQLYRLDFARISNTEMIGVSTGVSCQKISSSITIFGEHTKSGSYDNISRQTYLNKIFKNISFAHFHSIMVIMLFYTLNFFVKYSSFLQNREKAYNPPVIF